MEKAVDSLEGMFRKTEKDLDYMSRKLDCQLDSLQGVDQKVNPVKLMKKMELIKTEYANIVQDALAIQEAQKEFSDYFRSQVLTLTDMLQKLEMNTGQSSEPDESTKEVFEQLSNLLGIPPGELESQVHGGATSSMQASNQIGSGDINYNSPSESSSAEAIGGATSHGQRKSEKESKTKSESLSAMEKRAKNEEFLEITEEEFASVSPLIKQRLKLEDVNKVYMRLWQHFKEEKNKDKLSPKEMNAMGLRVTGSTGEAKLKVLRALKLCQINRTGDVTLT